MSEEDLKISVERHTTSKLDESDLQNIHTFGFRGEALPSIGSVSKMLITSKARGADRAYHIQLSGGHNKDIKPTIHNAGTKIEIQFYQEMVFIFIKGNENEILQVYKDNKGYNTIGIGFNMDNPRAKIVWQTVFQGSLLFDNVYNGDKAITQYNDLE